jgi:hypothetical protein
VTKKAMRLCLVAEFPDGSFSDLPWMWCGATGLWSLDLTPFPNKADAWLAVISTDYAQDERDACLSAERFHESGRNLPLILLDDEAGTVEVFGPRKPDGTRDLLERWEGSGGAKARKIDRSVFSRMSEKPKDNLSLEEVSPTEEEVLRKRRVHVAQVLRVRFREMIPVTWEEYSSFPLRLSAYEVIRIVQEKTGVSFEEAQETVEAEIPELFSGYWQSLSESEPTRGTVRGWDHL